MRKKVMRLIVLLCTITIVVHISIPIYARAEHNGELFSEVIHILQHYYAGKVSRDVLSADDIDEIIKALGDPYSAYMSPQEYRRFIDSIEMELVGIGVSVENAPDGLVITSVLKGSGAEEAGLQPGDVIVQADGVDLRDMDLSQAIMYIRGEENTSVSLTVKRGESTFSVKVLRKRISLPTVEWDLIDGVGYIRILSFGDDTPAQFKRALEEVKAAGARGLIVDLCGNGGGYLQSAVDMIGYFVGAQPATLVHVKSEGRYYIFSESDQLVDMPVLVLVDGYTASASELFAGALQDYGRASLIGSNTYGKGSIQWLFPLSDGSVLKLTVGYFYTPSGKQINGLGLKPDLALQDDFLLNSAVLLLSGDAEKGDSKKGFTAVQINDDIMDVDLDKARTDDYWESYRHIVESALSQGRVLYVGTEDGWQRSDEKQLYRWYFPYYRDVPVLEGIKPDKEFTVKFTKPVDVDEVKGKIQLIDAETGERVPCSYCQISDTQIKVMPDELLQNGREYYLVIREGIRARSGACLRQGVLCRAVVEE